MSELSTLKQQVAQLTQRLNDITASARKIFQLPWQSTLIPGSKLQVSNPSEVSQFITVQQILDAAISFRQNQLIEAVVTVDGNDVTVDAGAEWIINNVNHETGSDFVETVSYAATGYTRNDILVANEANIIYRIVGPETEGVSPTPNIPLNTVLVTTINVTDSTIVLTPPIDLDDYLLKGGYSGTAQDLKDEIDTKLNIDDYNDRFKGKFTSLAALETAYPTAESGDYAQVDEGPAFDVINYNYDLEDGWVEGGSGSAATNTDMLPEGSINLYFTVARVLATALSGISFVTGTAITAADTILSAFGKLQKQINDLSEGIVFETEITITSTVFDSTKKGDNKLYPFKSTSNQDLTINTGVYIQDDVINIERRGSGELEIIQGTGVRFRGVRTIDNRFFVGDSNTMVSLLCRGGDIFSIIGNLRRGGSIVTVSSYDDFIYTDVNKSINVYGTGFSSNMIVSISGNATQVTTFTYVNANQITLHLTSTGSAGDAITVTYDNGEVFQDTNAIVLLSGALTYVADSNPFSFGYALFKLAKTQVYGLQVRRDSDNAIVDVKFDSFGKISLSSFVSTGVTLASWAGSANVFIVTKYNQGTSGGNYNLTQLDSTKQAKLLNAGALIIQGSRMFAEFDGTNDAYSTTGNDNWCSGFLNIFADVRSKSLVNGVLCGYFPNTPRITERLLQFKYDSTGIISCLAALENGTAVTVSGGSAAINTNFNAVYSRNATNQLVYINGTSGTASAAITSFPSESKPIEHGGLIDDLNTSYLNGYNNYLIIYKIDNRASISSIQTIINAFL